MGAGLSPLALARVWITAVRIASLHWVPVEARESSTWRLGLGGHHRLPRACLKKACVDGLISGFGKQACSCYSDTAGCGAERRGAGGQWVQGLLEGWGPVQSWVWDLEGSQVCFLVA